MKQITKIALASYKNDILDESRVSRIIKKLNRKELRKYLKTLRVIEDKKTVIITVADKDISKNLIKKMKILFKGKKILVNEDKTIIAGIKITDFDTVYEFDLKSRIEKYSNFIKN